MKMKTFIEQVLEDSRAPESILDFIDERLGQTSNLAEDIGLTEEEYSNWVGDLTNQRDYIASLKDLIELKKLNRSASLKQRAMQKISEAQSAVLKMTSLIIK